MAAKVRRCCCRHKNKPKQTKKQVNQEKRSYLPLLRKRSTRMPPLKRTATWRMSSWVLPRRTPPKKMVGLGKAIPRAGALSPSAAGTLSFEHARSTENALQSEQLPFWSWPCLEASGEPLLGFRVIKLCPFPVKP